jgi:Sulfate permease family
MSVGSEIPPESPASASTIKHLTGIAPGVPALLRYRFAEDFPHDLVAGISVAAVALPVAVAYAQLAGFNPVVGLYSSILPLVVYAIFGTAADGEPRCGDLRHDRRRHRAARRGRC